MAQLLQITLAIVLAGQMAGAQRHMIGCAGQRAPVEVCLIDMGAK